MIAWIKRMLFPQWLSSKLRRFHDAKSEDFLENYYEQEANNELLPRD